MTQVSNGKRGANGSMERNSAFWQTTRFSIEDLLVDDVAEDAALLQLEVELAAVDLLHHAPRHDRGGDELDVPVLQRGPGRLAVVLEDLDVAEAPVLGEVDHPHPQRLQDQEDVRDGKLGELGLVVGVSMRTSWAPTPFILS